MSGLSRRLLSLSLAGLFVATFLPGMAVTGTPQRAIGAPAPRCAGASCCAPGRDCAMHAGCGGATAVRPSDFGEAPHRLCLTAPGCGAHQPAPAPHVFDPMLLAVAVAIAVPPADACASRAAALAPGAASSEPRVPPPRV